MNTLTQQRLGTLGTGAVVVALLFGCAFGGRATEPPPGEVPPPTAAETTLCGALHASKPPEEIRKLINGGGGVRWQILSAAEAYVDGIQGVDAAVAACVRAGA